jgi:hypothetical protein
MERALLFAVASCGAASAAFLSRGMASLAGASLLVAAGCGLVLEWILRRTRPPTAHARYAPWSHPRGGLLGRALVVVAESRAIRAVGELLPTISFSSDIVDVIYVNYLVESERLTPMVPWGLELQRLGPDGRYALFTFLTYNHGHFGPSFLGPLRGLFPSPVQSNWRIHVRNPQTGALGITFISTAINSTLHALAARWLSEGVAMHVPARAEVSARPDGLLFLLLDPGSGSCPDAEALLGPADNRELPPPWSECFADYEAMLAYCVPQDRALSSQPWYRRIVRQEIQLGIPLNDCEPLAGTVHSQAAAAIAGGAQPLCFRVARVAFQLTPEQYDLRHD